MAIIGEPLSVLALKAKVRVTTKAGATVKLTKGSTTLTGTASSSGITGTCDFEIGVPDFGTWSISCTSGNATGTGSVTVSDVTDYSVTVVLTLYLIRNGAFTSGISQNHVPSERWFKTEDDHLVLQTYQGGSNEYTSGYLKPATAFGYWKTLYIDSRETGDGAYAGICSTNTAQQASFTKSVQLCSRRDTWDSRHTSSCSVSGVTGNYYVTLRAKAWITWDEWGTVYGTGGQIRVWNLWLTG